MGDPVKIFNEIHCILKPNGIVCITDMRRDVNPMIKWMIYCLTKPKEIRPGFLSSLNASYTPDEIKNLLAKTNLKDIMMSKEFFGLCITAKKGIPVQ